MSTDKEERLQAEGWKVGNAEDFLAVPDRAKAGKRLGKSLAKLDTLNLPSISDEEVETEIQVVRDERTARRI